MWKNTFKCDIIGQKGSAHIDCLCKWGPSIFIYRKRVLPSGKPREVKSVIKRNDPTWKLEHKFFHKMIKNKLKTNLTTDYWIMKNIEKLSKSISYN